MRAPPLLWLLPSTLLQSSLPYHWRACVDHCSSVQYTAEQPGITGIVALHTSTVLLCKPSHTARRRCRRSLACRAHLSTHIATTDSRLQSLTRSLDTDMVVSHALVEAVRREMPEAQDELTGLVDLGPHPIRGRAQPIPVWGLQVATARTHHGSASSTVKG